MRVVDNQKIAALAMVEKEKDADEAESPAAPAPDSPAGNAK